jgi:DMSO/TMAO reductase YedYZ molybdopterin-dependent catalytic subunit
VSDVEHPLTRQIRLPEVGVEGQARLAAATLEVRGRDGSLAEFLYLHRAGVERLALRADRQAIPFRHAALFQHGAPARLAAGAWRAIKQIRGILAVSSDPR